MTVADIDLTVDVSGSAIVVSSDSEGLLALAVEGINDLVAVNVNVGEVVLVVRDHVNGGREGAALRVLFNSNVEVESPATDRNLTSAVETEVVDLDGAVELAVGHETSSGGVLLVSSVAITVDDLSATG